MAKFPSIEEMAKSIAEKALDTEYKGKTIREWIEQIANEQTEGEWEQFGLRNPKCSLCRSYNIEKSRFCPNCGARMRKEDDGK